MTGTWKRWLWGAGAALLTFALLWGGFAAYRTWAISKPLEKTLAQVAGVRQAKVTWQGHDALLTLTLEEGASLGSVYDAAEKAARRRLHGPFQVSFEDDPSPDLERLYLELNPILQEGLATGRFTEMAARVEERGQESLGVMAKVYVTGDAVWVLLQNKDHRLIRSLTRDKGGATP
ncbi:MAG: hypothetical protein QJR00_06545 [Bacillota bacterium]|nr:hypothetical protein [Bacillota bacterium]